MHGNEHSLEYFHPKEVSIQDGYLRILAHKRSYAGWQFTSGEIRSYRKFAQQYGRFVVRCRYPSNIGTWPAVFLLPADGSWPPEIDITEHIGVDNSTMYFTNHWQDSYGNHQYNSEHYTPSNQDWSQWHTYVMEWSPENVTWYVDGKQTYTHIEGIPQIPMYLRVNMAIGGDFAREPQDDNWPQYFDVDYIRVYQRQDYPLPLIGANQPLYKETDRKHLIYDHKLVWLMITVFIVAFLVAYKGKYRKHAPDIAFIYTTILAAGSYLLFRIGTINWDLWWLAIPLFLAEAFSLMHIAGFQYTVWAKIAGDNAPNRNMLIHELPGEEFRIYILIPTLNETADILSQTIKGAISAKNRYLEAAPNTIIRIIICNDHKAAGNPDWTLIEDLAKQHGIECVTRNEPGGAKAGNIEYVRKYVGAVGDCFIAIFDADQIAKPEFLIKTIPIFADPTVGWVQTGQYYRNLDNIVARWANDQQMLFYKTICPGKAAQNANFICGTNFVIRAAALDQIGGFPQDSITEDFAASLRLHGYWRSYYLTDILSTGLGPMDLTSYFAQQKRWATGTLKELFRHWQTIFYGDPGGFTPEQRIQYTLSGTNYFTGLRDLIFVTAPIVFLTTGLSPFQNCDINIFMWYFIPLWIICQLSQWRIAGFKVSLHSQILSFGSFPVLLISLFNAVFGRKAAFKVTSKKRTAKSAWYWLPSFAVLMLACISVILKSYLTDHSDITAISAMIWLIGIVVTFGIMLAIGVICCFVKKDAPENLETVTKELIIK